MSTVIESLVVKLGLTVDQAGFAKAAAAGNLLAQGITAIAKVAYEAAKGVASIVTEAAEYADKIQKASAYTGISTDAIQRLADAAKMGGIDLNQLAQGLAALSSNAMKAVDGSKEMQGAFTRLGLTTRELRSLSPDALFLKVLEGLEKIPAGSRRTQVAMQALGDKAKDVLPLLAEGSQAIKEMMAETVPLTKEQIQAGKELEIAIAKTNLQWSMMKRAIGGELLKPALRLAQALMDIAKSMRPIVEPVIKGALEGLINTFAYMAENAWALRLAIFAVTGGILYRFLPAILAAGTATKGFFGALAAGGIAGFISKIAKASGWAVGLLGLYMALEELWVAFVEGKPEETWFGSEWVKFLNDFGKPRQGEHWLTGFFRHHFASIQDLSVAWDEHMQRMELGWTKFMDFLQRIKGVAGDVIDTVTKPIKMMVSAVGMVNGKFGNGGSPEASAASRSSVANNSANQTNTVTTQVTIHAAPGQSPEAIGRAVANATPRPWESNSWDADLAAIPGGG